MKFLLEHYRENSTVPQPNEFWAGYWDGLESHFPVDTEVDPFFNYSGEQKANYLRGFVQGSIERQEEPKIEIPDWMTLQQVFAIKHKYFQNPDGSPNRSAFFKRFQTYSDGYCGAKWCGMFLGIEKDGYAHT